MKELASQSLDLVNRELTSTLESARAEIEDYVDGHADSEALLRAASMLHLAAGALKIVEVHGAALLAEEMEQTCRALIDIRDQDETEQGIEALTRAMVQLPAYLDRLLSGGSDVALVLLPLLNDLRSARKQPLLSEGTLLLLNTGPLERIRRAEASAKAEQSFGPEIQAVAQKLRPAFQAALLAWIKGDRTDQSLGRLVKACDALEAAAQSEPVKQLWSVLAGVATGLQQKALEPTVALKRLVGQADRQLKRLVDGGEAAFANAPPVDLLNSLLYYVARARSEDPRLVALRQSFGLDDVIPGDEQIERAREDLSGPSIRLMHTVAQAIKEDLAAVKDVLDIFVRTGMEDVQELKPQLEMLKKIGDTLGVLGLEAARNQIQGEARGLSAIVANNRVSDPAALERIAATLLDVEDALDRELVRAVAPRTDADADGEEETDESTQYRHVTQAVMRECIVNLAKIKDAVIKILDDPASVRALDQVKPQIRGITAGLLMLNKTKAVKIIDRIGTVIASRLAVAGQPLRQEHLERLADAIVSVEYYMETVSLGRTDPWYMLDNAERCIALLERLPTAAGSARPASEPAKAASPAPPEQPARKPESLSVMEVAEDRSEPELVEIFIEEAKEEIANIRHYLPLWLENAENMEALISVRRSFHTLKGSGRMVGAQLLGEFAWSVENLLNRVINQTLEATRPMIEFVNEAVSVLPGLIEQLEIGTAPKADVQLLMKRAEAFAEGDPDAESLTSASVRVQVLPADAAEAAEPAMDPVLLEIFVKEVRGHLATVRAFIESAQHNAAPHRVDEPLYRAWHTLFGSAKMANCQAAIDLAGPVEKRLGAQFQAKASLGADGLATLESLADEFDRLVAALESGESFEPDASLPPRLRTLEPAEREPGEPEPADETSETAEIAEGLGTSEPAREPAEAAADVSYDPEIAAIFAEEAAELLDQAETTLQEVEAAGNPAGPLRELQRAVHTLKGGARMAGVMNMGDLSHALETLLSGMAAHPERVEPSAVSLIQQCFDRLHQMRDAIDASRPVQAAADLMRRIEALESGAPAGEASAPATAAPPAAEEPAAAAPAAETAADQDEDEDDYDYALDASGIEVVEFDGDVDFTGTRPQPAPAAAPVETAAEPAAGVPAEALPAEGLSEAQDEPAGAASDEPAAFTELELEEDAAPAGPPALADAASDEAGDVDLAGEPQGPTTRGPERVEMARVDAALLDVLLNGAGEISIFQSRLNQQVHSIEFHLGELAQTVTRLREQLRSLEAETEAQILNRHQEDMGGDEQFDPLELDRYSTIQQLSRALAETSNDVASINELLHGLTSEADTLLTQQSRVTTELQDGLMKTRMVSFERQVPRLSRIVRQAAQDTQKSAELVVEGAKSQLDRQILENILPALEHLLRNAVVHGIESAAERSKAGKPETGTVTLKLRREGAEVIVDVTDDGAGLKLAAIKRKAIEKGLVPDGRSISDEEAVELILRPGFSTADELTQAAGRGVGMDVVDNEIKKLGGSLRVDTRPGQGTHFLIRLPYTLAITHALIVNVGEETFALPLPTVEGITRVRREQLLDILTEDDPRLNYGDVSYRVQHLGSLVGSAPSALPEEETAVSLVLIRAGDNSTALLTDSLEGSREIIVKTLGAHLMSIPGVSGATILGDGRVVVILDAGTLVRSQASGNEPAAPAPEAAAKQLTALVVDDSITMRRVTQRLLERRGVRVLTARDGLDAIEVLREHDADIILLDIEMPRMDGYQFATHVRNDQRLKDTPIIMVTSRSGEKHRAKAIEIGVNDYLSKPYQEAQLVAAVEALLGRSL